MNAMNPPIAPVDRRRGRLQLLALFAVVIGPMLLAGAMHRFGFWVPEARSYHGVLVAGELSRAGLGVPAADEPAWELLVTAPVDCAAACQGLVYRARQLHIGLGREAGRAAHGLATAAPVEARYAAQLEREYPQLRRYALDTDGYRASDLPQTPQLWLVDPLGNPVLRYGLEVDGKAVLEDLRHLMKVSKIG